MLTNFHRPTRFSDGSADPVAYVKTAIEEGLTAYGFSCHAPIPFEQKWCLREEDLPVYLETIAALKEEYRNQIELYCGLEIDYIPEKTSVSNFRYLNHQLDYTIGSVHYMDYLEDGTPCNTDGRPEEFKKGLEQIWGNDIRVAVKRYFHLVREMLAYAAPDIVAHIDKIRLHNRDNSLFNPEDTWYRNEISETIERLKKSGSRMETNTRGIYKGGFKEPYPSALFIKAALE